MRNVCPLELKLIGFETKRLNFARYLPLSGLITMCFIVQAAAKGYI